MIFFKNQKIPRFVQVYCHVLRFFRSMGPVIATQNLVMDDTLSISSGLVSQNVTEFLFVFGDIF